MVTEGLPNPFGSVAALTALREQNASPRLSALSNYAQARTGNLSELQRPAAATPAVGSSSGDALERLRAAIRTKESQGNYNARGQATRYGVARGAYQFLPSTYANFARQIGVDPNDWSPQTQDRVASHAMSTYMRQFGNDPRKVAIAWYAGPGAVARSSAALNARQSAGGRQGNMPSINAYADAILKLMG